VFGSNFVNWCCRNREGTLLIRIVKAYKIDYIVNNFMVESTAMMAIED
jgi:hypothetical protein